MTVSDPWDKNNIYGKTHMIYKVQNSFRIWIFKFKIFHKDKRYAINFYYYALTHGDFLRIPAHLLNNIELTTMIIS